MNRMTGRRRAYALRLTPKSINSGNKAANSEPAPSKFATLLDNTMRYWRTHTLVTSDGFPIMVNRAWLVPTEKNSRSEERLSGHAAKFGMFTLGGTTTKPNHHAIRVPLMLVPIGFIAHQFYASTASTMCARMVHTISSRFRPGDRFHTWDGTG